MGEHSEPEAEVQELIANEERFAAELGRDLARVEGARARMRLLIERAACEHDITLWVRIWARSLDDRGADRTRRSLDGSWRELIGSLVAEGQAEGVFSTRLLPAEAATLLASMIDGLALQATLGDESVPPRRLVDLTLWGTENLLGTSLEARIPADSVRKQL
jgi:hypothetical protein